MRLVELYERAVNWPSLPGILGTIAVATLLVILGYALSFAKRVWIGRVLGFLGFTIIMLGLFDLTQQTFTEKPNDIITVTRFRYPERVRGLLFWIMTGLPAAAVAIMWIGFVKNRYQRRLQVPRLLKAARSFIAQNDHVAAMREYNKAIRAAPELAEAYCRRGSLYYEMGMPAQALSDIDRAIASDPRYAPAYLERGKLRTESGDLDGALADFGQLMAMRATDPATYLHRGICLIKKGLVIEAAADFQRVLKLTNHSDYAEPAKHYLRHLDDPLVGPLSHASNGATSLPAATQPRAQDHAN